MSVSKRIVNRYVSKGVSENDMNTGNFLENMYVNTYVSRYPIPMYYKYVSPKGICMYK